MQKVNMTDTLKTLYSAQARRFSPIMIIGVENDGFNEDQSGYFEIAPVKIRKNERDVIETVSQAIISNGTSKTIMGRREKLGIKTGLNGFPH
jgi:hypothetical protein